MNTDNKVDDLINDMVQVCLSKGIIVKPNGTPETGIAEHMPISLFSTPFPINFYNQAKHLQPSLGVLLSSMATHYELIYHVLDYSYTVDPFIKKLIDVSKRYNNLRQEERQNIQMMILRTDYMIDKQSESLKLVEYNTIAAALSSLS